MAEKKPDGKRGAIAFIVTILIGLVIGYLIKRVHFGLFIGLAIGIFATFFLRKRL